MEKNKILLKTREEDLGIRMSIAEMEEKNKPIHSQCQFQIS